MSDKKFKGYPDITHISKEHLDENTSLAKILAFVGNDKQVIDFGCATGYLAKLLAEQGCKTVGIEINPDAAKAAEQFCERVIVADLDYDKVEVIIGEQKFDVAIFGDVLEHLRDPWQVLKSVKDILNPNGCVIASIPNVAHGSVRLALLEGRFEYSELGLLDNTHLRFFTHDSLRHLFESSGYYIESEDSTRLPIFDASPLTPNLNREKVSDELLEFIHADKFSDSLQFVVRAYSCSTTHGHIALQEKCCELRREMNQAGMELQKTQAELQKTQAELQKTQAELQKTQAELQKTQAESKQVVRAMESSKFWKIRTAWFKVKRLINPKPSG
ncbi:class I SAM-dependent methyltransferase [Leptolyngbya sp. BC1307]|uniref:class I SAM-dependent methyltransferase n=1 Tax=Leptolyngbya sp. BC1307 TaxID=2029589 RepID=UPI000EFA7548|nr:class I SAM-dependent methyltransferase [Leptolyngbya sp. BC1307]